MTYEFLSSEWISAVRSLRDEVDVASIEAPISISLNVTVTQAPSGAATTAHVDTTSGVPLMEEGHLEQAELHVTIDYLTARNLFVGGNPAAVMSALMEGKIPKPWRLPSAFGLLRRKRSVSERRGSRQCQ